MSTSRLEAFSDGVLAIIITIMVLELRVPEGHELGDLWDTAGSGLLTYLLSFVYIGIYWNNHHHMFQLVERVDGAVLWANLLLLFFLSLFPFTTAWMEESELAAGPVVVYGANLLLAGAAYYLVERAILRVEGRDSAYRAAVGNDVKGLASMATYVVAILVAAFVDPRVAMVPIVAVALLWLVPDRRVERLVRAQADARGAS